MILKIDRMSTWNFALSNLHKLNLHVIKACIDREERKNHRIITDTNWTMKPEDDISGWKYAEWLWNLQLPEICMPALAHGVGFCRMKSPTVQIRFNVNSQQFFCFLPRKKHELCDVKTISFKLYIIASKNWIGIELGLIHGQSINFGFQKLNWGRIRGQSVNFGYQIG